LPPMRFIAHILGPVECLLHFPSSDSIFHRVASDHCPFLPPSSVGPGPLSSFRMNDVCLFPSLYFTTSPANTRDLCARPSCFLAIHCCNMIKNAALAHIVARFFGTCRSGSRSFEAIVCHFVRPEPSNRDYPKLLSNSKSPSSVILRPNQMGQSTATVISSQALRQ